MLIIWWNIGKIVHTVQNLFQIKLFDFLFWLWPFGQNWVTQLYVFKSALLYVVQFLAKSDKPYRIYCKLKYFAFDFDLWPWG